MVLPVKPSTGSGLCQTYVMGLGWRLKWSFQSNHLQAQVCATQISWGWAEGWNGLTSQTNYGLRLVSCRYHGVGMKVEMVLPVKPSTCSGFCHTGIMGLGSMLKWSYQSNQLQAQVSVMQISWGWDEGWNGLTSQTIYMLRFVPCRYHGVGMKVEMVLSVQVTTCSGYCHTYIMGLGWRLNEMIISVQVTTGSGLCHADIMGRGWAEG
jgi:hypothetical protein